MNMVHMIMVGAEVVLFEPRKGRHWLDFKVASNKWRMGIMYTISMLLTWEFTMIRDISHTVMRFILPMLHD